MLKLLIGAATLVLVALGVVGAPKGVPGAPSATATPTPLLAPTAASNEETVEFTEGQLTDLLSARLVGQSLGNTPLGPATLQRLSVQLPSNQIQATGDAQVGGSTVPVTMAGHVDVQDGRPLVIVQDARAAGLPVPDSTRSSIQQAMQAQLDQELQRRQLRVTSVTISSGKLTIVGTHQR